MKKIICILTFSVALLLNCIALFATIRNSDSSKVETNPNRCYQTMGYCSPWDLTYMCTTNVTSEYCYRFATGCKLCETGYNPEIQ